jgi:hypothetical protein
MSDLQAPIAETSVPKENNSFYTIIWGPGEWTENRTDGVITSIDVKIKGWSADNVPTTTFRNTPPEGTGNAIASGEAGTFEETFTWSVPENLQTTATFGGSTENSNDDDYNLYYNQWIPLIKNTNEYITAYNTIKANLEAL